MAERLENLKSELNFAVSLFADLQQEHIASLDADQLKTLSGWQEKRRQAFRRLRQCLDQVDSAAISRDDELAAMVRQAIVNMQNGEKQLAASVKRRQGVIRQKLRTVRKGKTALRGYGLGHGTGSKPTYLSSRT